MVFHVKIAEKEEIISKYSDIIKETATLILEDNRYDRMSRNGIIV